MSKMKQIARQKLDLKLGSIKGIDRPPKGWIRAIREALGMTAVQFAKRLGIDPSGVVYLEKRELNKSVTLKQLERAAEHLGCRLEYTLIPHASLENIIEERAQEKARLKLMRVSDTMELEDQAVSAEDLKQQLEFLKKELLEGPEKYLWEEEDV